MASRMNTKDFFGKGTPNQYDFTLTQYDQALRLKAESKSSKPENVIKLDKWYQNELPKKIKSRGKDAHLVHDELVQTIKWKLARGKFFPQLTNLVRINTPKAVQTESRKAFRKLPNVEQAISTLTNLKGVGTTLASAVLAAGAPHIAPFMADECLLSMPECDGLDYTMKEYMRYVDYVKECAERLNSQSQGDPKYTPHIVELAVWTHYILYDLKPELLENMPEAKVDKGVASAAAAPADPVPVATPEVATPAAPEEPSENNGQVSATISADEDTKSSMASSVDEDSNSAKNHNNTHSSNSAETIAETPSAPAATTVPVESEAPEASEKVEEIKPEVAVPEVAAVENGNKIIEEPSEIKETTAESADTTPKTNGNSSHSNGSAEAEIQPEVVPEVTTEKPETVPEPAPTPAKEQEQQNGAIPAVDTAANNEKIEAKVDPQPNGELENGVNSSEKESTDLRSTSPVSAKRSLDEVAALEATPEQPSAKKLKTCEENATAEAVGVASEAAAATPATTTPAAATTTPQVAV